MINGFVPEPRFGLIHHSDVGGPPPQNRRLRLISFNIQVGIGTRGYHHYLTRSWQHFLPHSQRRKNLNRIASLLRDHDIVALQEADGGSLRSQFVNQVEYLAEAAGFPYWYQQRNRNLGKLGQHSNGLLSRYAPHVLETHRLPGLIPGRGAIVARFGEGPDALMLVVLHLALGNRAQRRQLHYIRELIGAQRHIIIMGDLNSPLQHLLLHTALRDLDLHPAMDDLHTFPSWKPRRDLDHILISANLRVHQQRVVDLPLSDHLPIAMEIDLPPALSRALHQPVADVQSLMEPRYPAPDAATTQLLAQPYAAGLRGRK